MKLSQVTLEELEKLEQALQENDPKSEFGHYHMLIYVYEEMCRAG